MKIGCLIYARGAFHERLAFCASRSFKKWHPAIPVIAVKSSEVIADIEVTESSQEMAMPVGTRKYAVGYRVMKELNLDKLIILGADTITCSRLDEFLDDNEHDILTTLDYPYPLVTPNYDGKVQGNPHVNADVVCFNNAEALKLIVERAHLHGNYFEQGALNEVCYAGEMKFSSRSVDFPYESSEVVYNARAKGNIIARAGFKPFYPFVFEFVVKDSKVTIPVEATNRLREKLNCLTKEKHLKVWHYCDGFGTLNLDGQIGLMNDWFSKGFNEETKKFFKDHCDCGDFFDGEFTL